MTMTTRERLLTFLRGGTPDRIPWSIYAWMVPDSEARRLLQRKGLGLMNAARIFRQIRKEVAVTEERKNLGGWPQIRLRIETPVGALTEEATIESTTKSRWIRKYLISEPEDYAIAEYVFRHTHFEPERDAWRRAEAEMGDAGIVVGEIMPVPLLYLMVSWMGVQGLVEGLYLHPDRFAALIDALNQHYDRQVELAAASPAEIIWFPDNVTASIISPRLFDLYCAPTYARSMPIMRASGKIPIAHYDGSIRPLLDRLARTDLPVMEAFTPPPMGDVSVAEAKAAWPDKRIWVNFPGCLFLEPADAIEAYTLDLLREGAPGGRLAIGCTEDFPLDAFEKGFTAIGRAMARYGGYEW